MTTLPLTRRTHWLLGGHPDDVALIIGDRRVTYAELAALTDARGRELGPVRRLVAIEAAPTLDFVAVYLAALAGEHPVLLLAAGDAERHAHLLDEYRPDVTVDARGLHERHLGTAHTLHPDLALLLSTSGSTGSPKLVRLSRGNVLANARSIADYLELTTQDVAATTLPLHYCYGLSVLHSHLLAGATVVLTDLSVADECFWSLAARTSLTGLAGVPHTFALLDAVDFAGRHLSRLPSLRYLTQAGGRMDPAQVRRYADLGRARGVDLFVMYGQTEATARMAYLPPEFAAKHPDTIGVPIPGGSLRVEPVPGVTEPGVGELVYAGPNVMMGYATSAGDLAEGPSVSELRTGDLARKTTSGLFAVVGRLDRHVKVLGHRVDLDRVESTLERSGIEVRVVARPECLWVFVPGGTAAARSRVLSLVRRTTGLRGAAVRVVGVDRLPLLASGKPDDAALREHVAREETLRSGERRTGPPTAEEVRDLYAVVLGRPDATVDDSFVGLGGDSLSYVEVSTRLRSRMGELPQRWQTLAARAMAESAGRAEDDAPQRKRRTVPVDVSVVLRAVAITLVVLTHADLFQLQGGAHVLLAVVGYNLVRFQLAVPDRRGRLRALLRGARTIAVPTVLFVGTLAALGWTYEWPTAVLLNGALGSDTWDDQWHFWFLETLVWSLVGLAVLLAVPAFDRALRARPFAAWLALLGAALAVRYAWTGLEAGPTERYTVGVVLWCVALGACAAAASTTTQRVLVAVLAAAATYGFFGDLRREAIVLAGALLLVLGRPVRLPAWLASMTAVAAAASLWIYLTHWQVYPPLEDAGRPVLAILASLGVGIAAHLLVTSAARAARPARAAARAAVGRWARLRAGSPAAPSVLRT